MATIVVSRGRNVFLANTYNITSGTLKVVIQTLSIDDGATGFADTDTALDDQGAISNEFDVAFDATPTIDTGLNEATSEATIPSGSGNFTIKRIAQHNETAANVTSSSDFLVSGVDGQSLTKTADFSILFRFVMDITDNS